MDPWEMFSELCRRVSTDGNVFLEVLITRAGIQMMLMPMDYDVEEDENEDEQA